MEAVDTAPILNAIGAESEQSCSNYYMVSSWADDWKDKHSLAL